MKTWTRSLDALVGLTTEWAEPALKGVMTAMAMATARTRCTHSRRVVENDHVPPCAQVVPRASAKLKAGDIGRPYSCVDEARLKKHAPGSLPALCLRSYPPVLPLHADRLY